MPTDQEKRAAAQEVPRLYGNMRKAVGEYISAVVTAERYASAEHRWMIDRLDRAYCIDAEDDLDEIQRQLDEYEDSRVRMARLFLID